MINLLRSTDDHLGHPMLPPHLAVLIANTTFLNPGRFFKRLFSFRDPIDLHVVKAAPGGVKYELKVNDPAYLLTAIEIAEDLRKVGKASLVIAPGSWTYERIESALKSHDQPAA